MTKRLNSPIYVTRPILPSLDEFTELLKQIWGNKILTNNGLFHRQFESKLADYLGVKYISLFANGTIALMTAIQALELKGEVVTTPYSFVATTHALWWNKITPVFVDVDPVYGNLDPDKIEEAITDKTTAILPVHVYGNPCQHKKIQAIADKYNLKLIYDAAHAFGVEQNGSSILNWGDLSILSFHATKVFNTIEGGAIVSHTPEMKKHIDHLKNFGFEDEVTVVEAGINGKMNELQAAYGLLQLKTIDQQIEKRKEITFLYRKLLKNIKGIRFLEEDNKLKYNYAYFPVFVESDYLLARDQLYIKLKENNIFGRRYFYPLISQFPMYRGLLSAKYSNLPTAETVAKQVICLPLYVDLKHKDLLRICEIIRKANL